MRLGVVFLFLGWFILYFLFKGGLEVRENDVDLHVADTYFVIAKTQFYILLFLISLNLFALGAVLGAFFRRKVFNLLFLFTLLIDGLVVWYAYTF